MFNKNLTNPWGSPLQFTVATSENVSGLCRCDTESENPWGKVEGKTISRIIQEQIDPAIVKFGF